MIPWINSALVNWAHWSVAQARREVGYSSVSPMFKGAPSSGVYRSYEPGYSGTDMTDIDRAVMTLPGVLRLVVVEYYQRGQTAKEAASRLGVRERQMFRYLDQAHDLIADAMAAVAVGG